jgi:nucleoside-diphosphate-sugar epimerase
MHGSSRVRARVAVTGPGGLVGRALVPVLAGAGCPVRALLRRPAASAGVDARVVGEIDAHTDWADALTGIGCVVHLAARVHVMRDAAADALAAYRRVDVAGTERLAAAAARAGVRRLVFVSSIKVHGEVTCGTPFRPEDRPAPCDPYAIAKWEAEQALHRVAGATGLEVVILRPPLIYGPGVAANFRRIMDLVARGVPLPLAAVGNRRSLLYAGNLADAILRCIGHPAAANRTFLVCDGEDLSIGDLIRRLAVAMGRPARLFPCPPAGLRAAAALLGRGQELRRLVDSLQVDGSLIRELLDWRPPYTVDEGLRRTVEARRGR